MFIIIWLYSFIKTRAVLQNASAYTKIMQIRTVELIPIFEEQSVNEIATYHNNIVHKQWLILPIHGMQ